MQGANGDGTPRAGALSTTVSQLTSKNKFAVASYFESSACVSLGLQVYRFRVLYPGFGRCHRGLDSRDHPESVKRVEKDMAPMPGG